MILDNIKSLSIVLLVCVCAYQHIKLDNYQKEAIRAQEQARLQTVELNNQIDEINKARENEQQEAKATISDLRINNRKAVSSSTSTTAGEGSCELSGAVANSLIDIAERADENARKLNQCIDAYNLIRK